jgi:hypothetical protein
MENVAIPFTNNQFGIESIKEGKKEVRINMYIIFTISAFFSYYGVLGRSNTPTPAGVVICSDHLVALVVSFRHNFNSKQVRVTKLAAPNELLPHKRSQLDVNEIVSYSPHASLPCESLHP